MAKIEKEVVKTYTLELSEAEYQAFESLIGAISYGDYKDYVNQHYSVLLHGGKVEKLKILTSDEHKKLYYKLEENR
jgi:hypothetical protein